MYFSLVVFYAKTHPICGVETWRNNQDEEIETNEKIMGFVRLRKRFGFAVNFSFCSFLLIVERKHILL